MQKINKKYYILCKLKQFGIKQEDMLKAWMVLMRPTTEYAAPLWHSGLLESDTNNLETLQKKAIGLILGTTYLENRRYYKLNGKPTPYEEVLEYLGLTTLSIRREALTSKFAVETFKNERHEDFFEERINIRESARTKQKVQEKACRTTRYYKSAIPYMSRNLNK